MPDSGKILFFDTTHSVPAPSSVTMEHAAETDPRAADALADLVRIIKECGQDPVTQLAGYLITEDPTYLPECHHARYLARCVGRDKLLEALIALYLEDHPAVASENTRL